MYPEMRNRLSVIKNRISDGEPLTKQELADVLIIVITFEKILSTLLRIIKKESMNNG